MSQIRDLLNDLVERRLWPVALLLVAALIAVPLVLAKSAPPDNGADSSAAIAAQAAAADAAAKPADDAVVSVAAQAPHGAPLHGKAKNPFKQQHVPKKPTIAPTNGAPVGGATPGTGGGPATGGNSGHPTGKAGGRLRSITDVPRLTPLPNASNPVAIFLGMRKDHETAVFMISSDVRVQGDGKCVPSKDDCEAIELKQGQIAFLDVKRANGVVDQYELDLVKVNVSQTTSKQDAQSAYARSSRAGTRLLGRRHRAGASNVAADSDRRPALPFRYAARRGVLHIAPWLSAHRAARGASRP
jgi:hypothetical protein